MAIITRPLSSSEVQKAKPAAKPYYLFDGRGLCLQIKPNGNKYWHCRYNRAYTGKATEISLWQLKWHTEFGHLNRGDMLTSEQHWCSNEKKKF
ncbi:integrase arm-type DNA-binding domain-containing protein [Lonsdalea quercina]|uniref:integrase arm-type DNA-binding domain-containing protein n=1 Tax=Lonsdalea quercina TaxID=71657 RepID=UPI003975DB0F